MEAIYNLTRLLQKHNENIRDLHTVFIDIEKAYDILNKEVIWRALKRHRFLISVLI